MEDITRLNEAFRNFTSASKSLEAYYERLRERVKYLTMEVEEKNRQLKDALSATEETKDYLKGILHNMGEAIIVLDLDGNVTMINSAAEKLFALDTESAVGKSFYDFDYSIVREGPDSILVVQGKRYPVILSYSDVLDQTGWIRGHVILIQDITRIKELETQNERNHRLIAMGEMAANIVHEIRSPLCSIELYASMLAKELEGTAHIDLAEGISTGIKSLNNILTNMLFFAKPHKPVRKPVELSGILEKTVFMLMPMIESRGLRMSSTGLCSKSIYGDSELIKQVFLNIVMNAIQVTPEGGKLGIELKNEEGFAIVEISDEGDGIAPENRERIFDPFFSTREKGTGLGLTIASRIMLAHGGTIKVKSSEGRGSCFLLYFPERNAAVSGRIMVPKAAGLQIF